MPEARPTMGGRTLRCSKESRFTKTNPLAKAPVRKHSTDCAPNEVATLYME